MDKRKRKIENVQEIAIEDLERIQTEKQEI